MNKPLDLTEAVEAATAAREAYDDDPSNDLYDFRAIDQAQVEAIAPVIERLVRDCNADDIEALRDDAVKMAHTKPDFRDPEGRIVAFVEDWLTEAARVIRGE